MGAPLQVEMNSMTNDESSDHSSGIICFFTEPQKALAYYAEHGFFIQPNVMSNEMCAEYIEEAHTLDNAKNGTFRPEMMPHRRSALFLDALKNKKIATIMEALLGGKPAGLQTEFFYCKPGTRGFSLHQDNFYVEAPHGAFASAWCALTDTYAQKGGLIVYPGTNKEGNLPTKKLSLAEDKGQDPNANNEQTIVPEKYRPMNAEVPKGAALFIHGHLVHGSNQNQTDEFRYVLLNTYVKQGENFRSGRYAQREEVLLD